MSVLGGARLFVVVTIFGRVLSIGVSGRFRTSAARANEAGPSPRLSLVAMAAAARRVLWRKEIKAWLELRDRGQAWGFDKRDEQVCTCKRRSVMERVARK